MEPIKRRFLELLEEDTEFRYAVAGYLGLSEILKKLDALTEEQVNLRKEQTKIWREIAKLREDMIKGFQRHDAEIAKLREDMKNGFDLQRRHMDALGARWGISAEESFRRGLKGIVEEHFGGRVDRWIHHDKEGYIYGHPSIVEADLIVKDKEHILIEVKSSISRGDTYELWKMGKLYEKIEGIKPRLAIVTPYIEEKAKKMAEKLNIEVYTI